MQRRNCCGGRISSSCGTAGFRGARPSSLSMRSSETEITIRVAETYKSSRRRKGREFHLDPGGDAMLFSAYIFRETVWLEGNVWKQAICLFCGGPCIEFGKNKSGFDGGAKTVASPVTDIGGKTSIDFEGRTTGNTNGWKESLTPIWSDACGKKKRFRRCARQAPEPLFASCTEKKSRTQSRKSGSRMTISLPSIAMMPSSCMRDSSLESALRSA